MATHFKNHINVVEVIFPLPMLMDQQNVIYGDQLKDEPYLEHLATLLLQGLPICAPQPS